MSLSLDQVTIYLCLSVWYIIKVITLYVTGPGSYNPRLKGRNGNPMITKARRFDEARGDEMPGPGAYQVRSSHVYTVQRYYFNHITMIFLFLYCFAKHHFFFTVQKI